MLDVFESYWKFIRGVRVINVVRDSTKYPCR